MPLAAEGAGYMPCLQIPASSISFANTFGVLFPVVFYDLVITKIATK